MSWSAEIDDALGQRTLGAEALPLSIGGEGCDVRLPGGAPAPAAAHVGVADGHAFVQPGDPGAAVAVNGKPLDASTWLADGDVVGIGDARIECRVAPGRLGLTVRVRAAVTPPAASPPAAAPRFAAAGPGWLRWALLGAFAVLVIAAAFVFLATPVEFDAEPADAAVSIDGALPTIAVGKRRLALPGPYRLRGSHPGYRPLERGIDVGGGARQTVRLVLEKLPGTVAIVSEPVTGAHVWIDGEPAGETPLQGLEVDAGPHRLRLAAERYLDTESEIVVAGMGRAERFRFELTPGWSPVGLTTVPAGATVRVGGEPAGVTPLGVDLMAGEHDVEIALAGYDTVHLTLAVEADAPFSVPPIELVESDGVVSLSSRPAGATVAVDGTFRGRTPIDLALAPRVEHAITLTLPGHAPASRVVVVAPAETRPLAITLRARLGVVFVTAEPPDAELLVDGAPRGAANQRLELVARPHRIEVRREGYQSQATTLTPRPGAAQTLDVRLDPVGVARERATPAAIETAEGQELRLVRPPDTPFRMGASRREPGRRANENLRDVVLSHPYYLGIAEVTNAEFRRFRPGHRTESAHGIDLDGDAQPVAGVTWDDAAAYLNWLSERDGLAPAYEKHGESFAPVRPAGGGYRLPTEAEWAFAARHAGGGGPRKYPWGEHFPPSGRAGNFADASAQAMLPNVLPGYDDGFPGSAPPGSFDAGPLGISDLGGNVAEWCQDYYGVYPEGTASIVRDPLGPETGKHHVVRGSSWRHAGITELRLSFRDYSRTSRPDLGFRIARDAN